MATVIGQLIADIQTAATTILKKDVTTIKGFAQEQLKALAQQVILIEQAIVAGGITPDTRAFFINNLKDLTLNFVRILQGLIILTVEKLFNAIIDVIFAALKTATGLIFA